MKELVANKITEFRKALTAGIEGIVRAAEIYVAAIDEDPSNADKFRDAFSDWIPSAAQVRQIGNAVAVRMAEALCGAIIDAGFEIKETP